VVSFMTEFFIGNIFGYVRIVPNNFESNKLLNLIPVSLISDVHCDINLSNSIIGKIIEIQHNYFNLPLWIKIFEVKIRNSIERNE